MRHPLSRSAAAAAAVVLLAGCGGGKASVATPAATTPAATTPAVTTPVATNPAITNPGRYQKLMLVMEENHTYDEVLTKGDAPFLTGLADRYGVATDLQAGYGVNCPSLPSYLILSSGADHGVCDDQGPAAHPLGGDNLFAQVKASGRQWRVYPESMPSACDHHDAGRYLVRHTVAPYYSNLAPDCPNWDLPLGKPAAGRLHDDLTAGQLPAFTLVVPDACDDMHGGSECSADPVRAADDWIRELLAATMAGPDWASGHLVVVIAWDEGSETDNHIPALVLSPTTSHVREHDPLTNCAILRLMSDVLAVTPLGCAQASPALRAAFGL